MIVLLAAAAGLDGAAVDGDAVEVVEVELVDSVLVAELQLVSATVSVNAIPAVLSATNLFIANQASRHGGPTERVGYGWLR